MPARELMGWNKSQRRWEKMKDGKRVWITCAALGLPHEKWNKEDSYQVANQWWLRHLAGLRAAARQEQAVLEADDYPRVPELRQRADHARRVGDHAGAAALDAEVQTITTRPPDEAPLVDATVAARLTALRAVGVDVSALDPVAAQAILSAEEPVWADRMARAAAVDAERAVGPLAERYVAGRRSQARDGSRSHEGADAVARALAHFVRFVGPAVDVNGLKAARWGEWYDHCQAMVAKHDDDPKAGWAADTAAKYFGLARSFVRWCYELEYLEALPRNIANREHKFERPDKTPPTFSDGEVARLVAAAQGQHRLLLLLMLNTGATQRDVSDLLKTQIDLAAGRITRRRSKMRKRKASREVSYKLWPATLALLEAHLDRNPAEPRALVTKGGRPWVWTETTPDGKLRKSDNAATVFTHLKRRAKLAGPAKSLKVFRKTSASAIANDSRYDKLEQWFLGHKEKTTSRRHYVAPEQTHLDAAVDWLGERFGRVPADQRPATDGAAPGAAA